MSEFNQRSLTEIDEVASSNNQFKYMMLSRLKDDCDQYLGPCYNRDPKRLWAEDEATHIECMKRLFNSFSDTDKPQWLSEKELLDYERELLDSSLSMVDSNEWKMGA